MNTNKSVAEVSKKVVKVVKYYTPIVSLFDKRNFIIDNYGQCKGNRNKFITLRDAKGHRVVTFIAQFYGENKYGAYKRNVLYWTHNGPALEHNKEIVIYGRKFIILDKVSKKGDFYVIKSDTHRLVGFYNPTRKVVKFPNICLQ